MAKTKKRVAKKQPNAITRFFRETVGELRKVSWPSREEAVNLTKIVVIVMALMAVFLGGLDFAFFRFFEYLFSLSL